MRICSLTFGPSVRSSAHRLTRCCLLAFMIAPLVRAGEAELIKSLGSGSTEERDAARQTLLRTATPAAIPALAAQLTGAETFDNACFLLESLRCPDADAALASALDKTSGREQAGLLDALARRDAPLAEKKAAALLSAAEPVRTAALHYLGTLATPDALNALCALPTDRAVGDALLLAADRLVSHKDTARAIELYARLYRTNLPDSLRLAALAGLVLNDADHAQTWLTEGLGNASSVWRGTAARLAAQQPPRFLKKHGAALMAALPAEGRLAFINALVATKNRNAAALLRVALEKDSEASVRLAAAAGLGDLGTARDAATLIGMLGQSDAALADAARMSLIKLGDSDANADVIRALRKSGDTATRLRLINVITFRKAQAAAPDLPAFFADADAAVRTATFQALTDLATAKQVPAVVAAAAKASDSHEKNAAEKALFALSRKYPDAATDAVAQALAAADPERRSTFLFALGIAATPAALPYVQNALKDADTAVAEDALRVLSDWQDPAASGTLLAQAQSNPNNSLRILALRGYIRLADKESDAARRAEQLGLAQALVTRPEEKTQLIAAWGRTPVPAAVDALKGFLKDDALKTEALKALRAVALKVPVDIPDKAPGSLLTPITFVPHRIGTCRTEACAVADFNGDGKPDIAAGPYLYLAPDWKPIKIRQVESNVTEDGKGYADDFCNLVLDVNKDGKPDIVSGGWFSKTSYWFENTLGKEGLWPVHVIDPLGNHETGTLEDIDGDGLAREFLPQSHITVWYELGKDANGASGFVKHVVSDKGNVLGAGVGDISGDKRPDIIRPDVWFEAPKDIRNGKWIAHPIALGGKDGKVEHTSNIIVFDVNKDGLNDLIVSTAHKYGIFWYEQQRDKDGNITWKQHVIDDTWTQAHYLAFADIDGDGNKEIITGKRFMAHNGGDPDEYGKLGIFYYRFTPGPNPVFRKHVITYDEGISAGLNIIPVDIDGDGDIDLVTTGKWGGPVLLENRGTEWMPDAERLAGWEITPPAAEPVREDNLALASRGAKAASDSELNGAAGCTAKLNDGVRFKQETVAQTRWHSALTPMPHWAEVKLAKPARVGRVIARFADPAGYATAYDIQVKSGNAYKTVSSTDSNRESQTVNVTFAPVETDTVRFVFRKNANPAYPNAAQLSELEAYPQ